MAEQIKMFHDQLADLIVMDVRRHARCQGFKSVTLYRHRMAKFLARIGRSVL